MGTDCAPLLANLFLFYYEYKYMKKLIKTNIIKARRFNPLMGIGIFNPHRACAGKGYCTRSVCVCVCVCVFDVGEEKERRVLGV